MNAGIHKGYIKHLHRRQKETCITLCYVDIFLEWSDYKNICDINRKQTKKSHRPHHCQEIAIIIHHHPRHHHFDHHHYKHFCLHIYIDECSEKIYVCDVNAKCTNINGSHNCTCTDGLLLKFITMIEKSMNIKSLVWLWTCAQGGCVSDSLWRYVLLTLKIYLREKNWKLLSRYYECPDWSKKQS